MQKSQITIVGAGIPGLTLALILASENIDVTLIDRKPLLTMDKIEPSGRTAALMQGSIDILSQAKIWSSVQEYTARLKKLSIIDDSFFPRGADKMVQSDFDAHELNFDVFGYNVPLNRLLALLADQVRQTKNIKVSVVDDLQQSHKDIVKADLVVGADGRNSVVREWAGIKAQRKNYDQSAITCLVSHSLSHHDTSTEYHRSGGPCTFVPYDENMSAVVWVEKQDKVDDFMALSKSAFINALQERSRGLLGQIDLIAGPEAWPLMTLKANRFIAPKTALIAEAAHVLSPIGAQGLNLSLRDVGALVSFIKAAIKNGQDIGSLTSLEVYERERQRDIVPRYHAVHALNQSVINDNLVMKGMRRFGLRTVKFAGPLRQLLMQEGLSPNYKNL